MAQFQGLNRTVKCKMTQAVLNKKRNSFITGKQVLIFIFIEANNKSNKKYLITNLNEILVKSYQSSKESH